MSESFTSTSELDFPELRQLPGLATAAQVAAILKCSKRHVLNECHAGHMAFVNNQAMQHLKAK